MVFSKVKKNAAVAAIDAQPDAASKKPLIEELIRNIQEVLEGPRATPQWLENYLQSAECKNFYAVAPPKVKEDEDDEDDAAADVLTMGDPGMWIYGFEVPCVDVTVEGHADLSLVKVGKAMDHQLLCRLAVEFAAWSKLAGKEEIKIPRLGTEQANTQSRCDVVTARLQSQLFGEENVSSDHLLFLLHRSSDDGAFGTVEEFIRTSLGTTVNPNAVDGLRTKHNAAATSAAGNTTFIVANLAGTSTKTVKSQVLQGQIGSSEYILMQKGVRDSVKAKFAQYTKVVDMISLASFLESLDEWPIMHAKAGVPLKLTCNGQSTDSLVRLTTHHSTVELVTAHMENLALAEKGGGAAAAEGS